MTLNPAEYLEDVRLTKSKGTYREYSKTVDRFLLWCGKNEPSTDLAKGFVKELIKAGRAPATVARHAAVLRMLFESGGIVLKISVPVKPKKLPSWLEEEEMYGFLTTAKRYAREVRMKEYFYPAAVVMVCGGLRAAEVLGLCHKHVDRTGKIQVYGKRDKERIVKIHKDDFAVLWNWVYRDQGRYREMEEEIFPGGQYWVLYGDVRAVAKLAGLQKRVTPHVLRHTCGTHLASIGMSVDRIAQVLGDTIEVARIYIHISADDIQKQMPSITNKQ